MGILHPRGPVMLHQYFMDVWIYHVGISVRQRMKRWEGVAPKTSSVTHEGHHGSKCSCPL